MTLSVGHFKGRYEAWNWKYQIEDTITMTMELELQVDEASVNSQHNLGLGKQSNRELLFSLLLFSNNVICEATKLPLLFFLTNPSPLNFLLSRLNTPPPIQQPTILPNSTLSPLFVFVLQACRVVFFFWHLDAAEYWLHFCLLFKLVELFWSNYLSYHQEVRPDIHV